MSAQVSIIVPVYNAQGKLSGCLDSLRRLKERNISVEVIFVDDCSTDDSLGLLQYEASMEPSWSVEVLPENSGSPSTPRNHGASRATGEYVCFLDADDAIVPDGVVAAYELATQTGADIVRSPMYVTNGSETYVHNAISDFPSTGTLAERASAIFEKQSTTPPMLISRDFLVGNSVRWRPDLHMGEDTVFLAELVAAASTLEYSSDPLYIYDKSRTEVASTTQKYGERELTNHLLAWSLSQNALELVGVDYFSVRGKVALQAVLQAFLRSYTYDLTERTFGMFCDFLASHESAISGFRYSERLMGVLGTIKRRDFPGFIAEIRPRLLIAGYDLKFILPAIPLFESRYSVRVDEWSGHDSHSSSASTDLLRWADVIWCEWMLGNAVWYSKRKRPGQRLVVRMHRFEQFRDFGHRVAHQNIDAYITVSAFTLEDFVHAFSLDRARCHVIPNYIRFGDYSKSDDPERVFRLAMVGSVPLRKGVHRAFELLHILRSVDKRYTLTLLGHSAKDLPWLSRIDEEQKYFADAETLMHSLGIADAVTYAGWVDTTESLADYGFVLSTSDDESFHVSPFEAIAAGNNAVVRRWRGAEYVYPDYCLANDVDEMAELILGLQDLSAFNDRAAESLRDVSARYSTDNFTSLVYRLLDDIA